MKILIKNIEYQLKEAGKFGREGEIFSIEGYSPKKLAKVYDVERRTSYMQRKVTTFINKFRHLDLGGVENFIAFPEVPIYEADSQSFCGFLMKNFSHYSCLFDNRYDLTKSVYKNINLDDSSAISIIDTLFAFLQVIHKAGFILGDINPENILLDNQSYMPALVDFDSAQLGTFYSNTSRKAYIDPTVTTDGYGRNKYFIYTTDSDIYSLAIVCYEFIIGIHPYFFQTTIPTDNEFKKANDLSVLDYVENNKAKVERFSFDVFENAAYKATVHRLGEIGAIHKELYSFFRTIFLDGKRYYFSSKNSKIYSIRSKQEIDETENTAVDLISQTKEDPDELELFMKQFNLSLY